MSRDLSKQFWFLVDSIKKLNLLIEFWNSIVIKFYFMRIALAKFRSARGASHQPVLMGSCLTISHTCLSCLPSRWVKSLCSTAPYDWTGGGSVDLFFFLNGEYGFSYVVLMLFFGMGVKFKDKIMYYRFREVK